MGTPHRAARTIALTVLVSLVVTACGGTTDRPQADGTAGVLAGQAPAGRAGTPSVPAASALPSDRPRGGRGVIASGGPQAPYNYGPTVMADGGRYRMWWCSQLPTAPPAGDDLLYADSGSLDGGFGQGRAVFSGSGAGFDAMHTCDPSVLRVGATYYLYYTGSAGNRDRGNAIGLATSPDGVHWTRALGGRAIVAPSGQNPAGSNEYGAGQPSVVYLDGWFYLMYTDTTARGAGWNGAGQFVLRATEPTFTSNVQSLGDKGFVDGRAPRRSIVDAFSADWMWVDALDAFAVAHETPDGTTITFWDREFLRQAFQPIVLRGTWQEGPGLSRAPDGHAPVDNEDPCGRVQLDVVRATRNAASPTDLMHVGIDLYGLSGCADRAGALALLQGFGMPSPQRTVDLVVGDSLVEVDRRSVAAALAVRVLDAAVPALNGLPVAGRLPARAGALAATGRPLGLLLADGRLCPVGSAQAAALNSSTVSTVTAQQWDGYPAGPDLTTLRG